MIARFPIPYVLPNTNVIATERAFLSCGCCVFLGVGIGDNRVTTVSTPCCKEHSGLMKHVVKNLDLVREREWVQNVDAIHVCDEILRISLYGFVHRN